MGDMSSLNDVGREHLLFWENASFHPPTPERDDGPDGLYESKRPSSLKEPVRGSQDARASERQDEPMAAVLERVGDEHRRDGEQAKAGQRTVFFVDAAHFVLGA